MANRILFDANDDKPYASKLWVSDGTTAGSTEISGSAGYDFTQLGGIVVFISGNGVLWRTNGTVAGTSQIVPATTVKFTGFSNSYLPASAQLAPQLLPIGNALLFLGDDGTHGSELWRTDGTAAGTTMVKDIYPGNTQSSRIADMTAFGNGYLFEALDDTHGLELFKTDGTTAGTVLVKDIEPNGITSGGTFYPYSSSPNNITVLGDGTKAVFAATVLTNNGSDREVWVTDGTAAGTTMVKQINADSGGAMPDNITQLGHTGRAVFQATDKPVNTPSYTKGAELWVTDGTAAGTTLIKDLDPGKQATLSGFKQIGDKLLFTSQEDGYGVYSPGLWVTDGTAVGTIKLLSSAITGAFGLVDFGSKELFWTNYNAGYSTPWITDGTVAGTIQLSATAVLGDSYGWAVLGSIALFSGDTGNYNGTELWQTDGTAAGTRVARDIYPEVNKSSYPQHFAVSGGSAYFQADSGNEPQLWTSGPFGTSEVINTHPNTRYASAGTPPDVTNITAVTLPCFAAGTRIATVDGTVAVETLLRGDLVRTAAGGTRPVRWVGHRHIVIARHPQPLDVSPICVAPHAFGPGLPHTALRLSPEHAVYAEGLLIPVRHLINGTTIAREAADAVTWYHVELAGPDGAAVHDVLLAEGLPAESFLDTGNRESFANGGPAVTLVPAFTPAADAWAKNACAPLCRTGAGVDQLRATLARHAAALGYPSAADMVVSVERTGRLCVDLPRGVASIRLRSPHSRLVGDSRTLGVTVTAVSIDGAVLPLADGRLAEGFHGLEGASDTCAGWRWTDGDAVLRVGAADTSRSVTVEIAAMSIDLLAAA